MEENFTLAVIVFFIGLTATLSTAVTILVAHRRSEQEFRAAEEVGS